MPVHFRAQGQISRLDRKPMKRKCSFILNALKERERRGDWELSIFSVVWLLDSELLVEMVGGETLFSGFPSDTRPI